MACGPAATTDMTGEARTAGFVAVTSAASCLAVSGMVANDLAFDICGIITGRGALRASQGMLAVVGVACCAYMQLYAAI